MSGAVYFASDLHFGAGSPSQQRERVVLFQEWLQSLSDASHLYLLGDVFDFWMDTPNFMPKQHFEVLHALRQLADRGVELRFVGGNHDIWCTDYLRDHVGFSILPSGSVVEHQGRRLRLHHGDGLLAGDTGYRLFRAIVRNPAIVFLAKCVHPELTHRLAHRLSHGSREMDRDDPEELKQRIRRFAAAHPQDDVDVLIIGHIHLPHQERFGKWLFHCLGDWLVNYTAGRLLDGELQIVRVREALGR